MKPLSLHTNGNSCLVTYAYEKYRQLILSYIIYRTNHRYEAEDLTQDVFVRLLDYKQMLREDTVRYFLFTIARNIVIDYLRRHYKKQEITSYIYDTAVCSTGESDDLVVKDILALEKNKLQTFSDQRKKVYILSRFEGKTPFEISEELQLSKRTIENHLLIGRKIMRTYIRQCI
jgi:RNA polymerase sigma-70 factor (ECF subfamily)